MNSYLDFSNFWCKAGVSETSGSPENKEITSCVASNNDTLRRQYYKYIIKYEQSYMKALTTRPVVMQPLLSGLPDRLVDQASEHGSLCHLAYLIDFSTRPVSMAAPATRLT